MRALPLFLTLLLTSLAMHTQPASPKLPTASASGWGVVVVNADGSAYAVPDRGKAGPVTLPRKAVQAAVNDLAAFVLLEDGSVYAWGSNAYNSLGAPYDQREAKTPFSLGLQNVAQIAAAQWHGVSVNRSGFVYAWGSFDYGLRGTLLLYRGPDPLPVTQVPGLTNIVQVAAGATHNLALNRDGQVYAWGANNHGQLGSGEMGEPRGPALVPGIDNVVAIAAGADTSLALKKDGTVWAWGSNTTSMFGNGKNPSMGEPGAIIPTPTLVKGVISVHAITASNGHVIVLLADGTLRAWGFNGYGQIGIGTSGDYAPSPVRVRSLTGVTQISSGTYRSFAVTADGRLWHWGATIPANGLSRSIKIPEVLEMPPQTAAAK